MQTARAIAIVGAMLPQGMEELPGRPGAVGVKPSPVLTWLLVVLAVVCLGGGIALCFTPAKESAETDTLWPVGLVFIVLGAICVIVWLLTARGHKFILDDTGLHSRAVFGRYSVRWDAVEKLQPVRGGVWITAPGGILKESGDATNKKTLLFNTRGLATQPSAFIDYIATRARNGGRAPA